MKITSMDLYHNTQGTSNKFYLGIKLDDGNYLTVYGGVQGTPTLNFHNQNKKVYNNFLDSVKTAKYEYYHDKLREKENKGYSKISTLDFQQIIHNTGSKDYKDLYNLVNKSKFQPIMSSLEKEVNGNNTSASVSINTTDIDEEIEKQKKIKQQTEDKNLSKNKKEAEKLDLLKIEKAKSQNKISNEIEISFY